MKKTFALLVLSLALVGCGDSKTPANQESGSVVTGETGSNAANEETGTPEGTEAPEQSEEEVQQPEGEGVIGDKYEVAFGEAEKVNSTYGDGELLLINYTFTNNSEETVSADFALMITAYQDGIEMDKAYESALTGDNESKSIRPGSSLECKTLFKLSSTSEVEVEAEEFLGMDDSKVSQVYTLQ